MVILIYFGLSLLIFVILWPVVKDIIRSCLYNRASSKMPRMLRKKDMSSTIAIITGSSSGIGMQVAQELAEQNANILFACRNEESAQKVIKRIRKSVGSGEEQFLEHSHLDLSSLESIRTFSKNILELELPNHYDEIILLNNAGEITPPSVTDDGIEAVFQVNYVGPFLLSHYLLPMLKKTTKPSRIINVSSSMSHQSKEDDFRKKPLDKPLLKDTSLHGGLRYPRSKLALNAFTNYFHNMLKRDNSVDVDIVALCPGMVNSMMMKKGVPLYMKVMFYFLDFMIKTLEQGARTPVYLSLVDYNTFSRRFGGEFVSGFEINKKYENRLAKDYDFQDWLVKKTEELVGEEFEI